MKIAVMAAGAVGGYFGGRLAAAGEDVHFLARGTHYEALAKGGLRIESPLGDLRLAPVAVHSDPAGIGPVDVLLFAVKLWDSESAAEACRPLIGPGTVVIPLQNGVGNHARLAALLGQRQVAGGVAYIAAAIAGPGTIRHNGSFARLIFGEADGGASPRLEAFRAACARAGIEATLSADIEGDQWRKFVFLVGLSGVTALTRRPIGPVRADADGRALLEALMAEVVAVGRAGGVDLGTDFVADRMAFVDTLPATMKASMLEDLERGNRLELDWLAGEVVRRGRELGVATPANLAVFAGIRPFAGGAA